MRDKEIGLLGVALKDYKISSGFIEELDKHIYEKTMKYCDETSQNDKLFWY